MADRLAPFQYYLRLIGAHIRSQLQYRTSFVINVAGAFLITFLDFAAVLIIFHNVPSLGGWTVGEVAFLYAMSWLSFSFAELLVGHLDRLPEIVRDGNFDLLLIRPRGTLLQVMASDFQIRRVGHILQSLVILVYALSVLDIDWTIGRVLMSIGTIASGTAIFASVWVFAICIVFWAVEGREVASAFTYGGQFFTQFPSHIYERWLRRFLGYLVPMAFVTYMPALYILSKPDPLGLPPWMPFIAVAIAAAATLVAGATWQFAVRHYRSAGG